MDREKYYYTVIMPYLYKHFLEDRDTRVKILKGQLLKVIGQFFVVVSGPILIAYLKNTKIPLKHQKNTS